MTPGRGTTRALALAAALSVVAATGCSLFRSDPGATAGDNPGVRTGQVVLTARGAMIVLRGDTTSLSQAVEDMFENLDIYLVGESSIDGGKQMRGQAGTTEIFVDLNSQSGRETEVRVRVRETGAGSQGRWDRIAARGLAEEIRRWAAQ